MADTLTNLFLAALALSVTVRIWLARRHIGHIRAHRAAVPAGFAGRIPLAAHQKAADYAVARTRFGFAGLAVDTALLLAFTLGGGLAALSAFWSAHADGIWHGLALILSVMAISGAADIPLAAWRQFVIEERFGFNRMTPALFVSDLVKGALLGAAIGTPLVLAVLWLMAAMGERWWLYVWAVWCAFNLAILFVYPAWIAPLFNKFTPLAEGDTKARIEALLARCGFRSGGLFVMDGSKRSAHGNAYFTGFGKTKRIVFFDTLLERLQPAEIEAVLAHELGHFRHRHVQQRIALMFAVSLAFLALLGQLIDAPWFFAGLGVESAAAHGQAMALVLFALAVPVFAFPLTPLGSLLSRRNEFEADRYAAAHASSDDLVRALVKLYEDNAATLTPDPLHSLFYDSHPPAAIRIARLQQAATQ
ncbi:M48 family metallopeptidase [Azospira restricta]|uniref:M48 family metallopeptidase n=1 Tax=Azospira restricta TaxID=404405 RepID=A0A974PXU0_9RHOO|nr:M48 family metallopeptidase [Azospira restricta]QRJ63405.1 M48 family metallopeptidase [Azospira restricta]